MRFWLLAVGLTVACGTAPNREPRPAPVVSPRPSGPKPPPRLDHERFIEHLETAQSRAQELGWVLKSKRLVENRLAGLLFYSKSDVKNQERRRERFDAVSLAATISRESGRIELALDRSKRPLWRLRGDEREYVVVQLTSCEKRRDCGHARALVLELSGSGFAVAQAAPQFPASLQDADRDGVPEFTYPLVGLEIATCRRKSCGPTRTLMATVLGYESYRGGDLRRDLRSLVPLYMRRLAESRRAAQRLARVRGRKSICPLAAIKVAAELYVYARLVGERSEVAMAPADKLMKEYSTGACFKEYELLDRAKTWPELRKELVEIALPEFSER